MNRALRSAVLLLVGACSSTSKPAPAGDPVRDGGTAAESGVDGSHPPGTWCAAQEVDFCDDFDAPSLSATAWSGQATSGDTGVGLPPGSLDTMTHTSDPNAFRARTPTIAGVTAELLQIHRFVGGPDALHVDADVSFAVRLATVGASARTEIARVVGVNPITFASYGVAILVSASGASVELTQGSGGSVTHALVTAPKIGAWSRVALHLSLERTVTGAPTSFVVQIDGGAPETFSIERGMGVRPALWLGLSVTGPAAPSEVAYDDVTCSAR